MPTIAPRAILPLSAAQFATVPIAGGSIVPKDIGFLVIIEVADSDESGLHWPAGLERRAGTRREGFDPARRRVELVLEMARAYAARGMADFSRALWKRWEDGDAQAEGRPDAESGGIDYYHSLGKGS